MSQVSLNNRCSFMPRIYPGEHLISAICRGALLGNVKNWRYLSTPDKKEGGNLSPSHVLRPLFVTIHCGTITARSYQMWQTFHLTLSNGQTFTTTPGSCLLSRSFGTNMRNSGDGAQTVITKISSNLALDSGMLNINFLE